MAEKSDPADLGAVEARRLMMAGDLSARELAEACIARVERINPAVNALVACDFDRLADAARKADEKRASGGSLSALLGLPIAIKDMSDMAGLPTTYGSKIHSDNIPEEDDASVARLAAAGGIPMAKANNPEWSAGANTRNPVYGTTCNPYDTTRNCGGSSGGSAVALACGFSPLATGSDLAGSLRTPAAYCGVVGFRPTAGVVPDTSREIELLPLSTSGPMARSVADCGLMLSVMSYPERQDYFSPVIDNTTPWTPSEFAHPPLRELSGFRVAFTEDFGFAPVENATRATFRDKMASLGAYVAHLDEATPDCTDADRLFSVLRGISYVVGHGPGVKQAPEMYGENVCANVAEGLGYSARDITQALAGHGAYFKRWQSFFDQYDFLLTPTVSVSARDWHELYPAEIDGAATRSYYHWLALAYAVTLAGHPAITIPCGKDPNGLPFGLQLIGKRHGDLELLSFARALEEVIAGVSDLAPFGPDLEALSKAPPIEEAEGFWPG